VLGDQVSVIKQCEVARRPFATALAGSGRVRRR